MIAAITAMLDTNKAALGVKLVGNAADFQTAAETKPAATPAVYVLGLEANAGLSELDVIVQRVTVGVGIVVVVRNLTDAKGIAAGRDIETLCKGIKDLIFGWQPADGYDPLQRTRSALLAFRDGHMWWQDGYVTAFYDKPIN